jgi:hypothetical protein
MGVWVAGTPTGLTLALLGEFASDMRSSHTINQLALSTSKAYANVHAAATSLIKEGILTKETVGHSHQCKLNLANDKTLIYLSLLETVKRDELLRASPETRLLLSRIDRESAKLGILLAWHRRIDESWCTNSQNPSHRGADLLVVTTQPHTAQIVSEALERPSFVLPLAAFLSDSHLRATIGSHTLLFGHALYTSLLKEVPR